MSTTFCEVSSFSFQYYDYTGHSRRSQRCAVKAPHDDISTAILRPNKFFNCAVLEEAIAHNNPVATLNPATVDALQLSRGDTTEARRGEILEEDQIQVIVARAKPRVKISGLAYAHACSISTRGEVFYVYLQPYFLEAYSYRPFWKGGTPLFVVEWNTSVNVIISEGGPVKLEDEKTNLSDVGHNNIHGCRSQAAQIRELVKLYLRLPQHFN
ncbi:hypothetical protein BC835DRAFT_1417433 [Cytidiella melzeri]|nr:hypothetical protein BC835DRAFT_1417433 [Cytidiella melzeri]